jgi:hypothetical protein
MPTNNIKHLMLKEAKRIATKEYIDRKVKVLGEVAIIDASMIREEEIHIVLENHPEYDEDIFRGMIRTFQKKDNSDDSLTV